MQKLHNKGAIVTLAVLLAWPIMSYAQGILGGTVSVAQEEGTAADSAGTPSAANGGAAGLLKPDQRPRFREYAIRQHRPTPYSLREPVTVGTLLPPTGITLYVIPPEFGVAPEYRYAVVNNLVLLVDPVTHEIVEVVD